MNTVIKHVYETYLHEYGHYDQSIGAFSSFCIICVQLMIVVDQLNLEHTETYRELLEEKSCSDVFVHKPLQTL